MKSIPLSPQLYEYLASHRSDAADNLLEELRARTTQMGDISEMQIAPEQGTFLSILVASCGARRAIEIGTFTGYSAICIARALPDDGHLLCCDISAEYTDIAREFWERGTLSGKIELRLGAALETIASMSDDERFDFAFIDADKTGYDGYYEAILPRMERSALIVFDNMLRGGRVLQPEDDNDRAIVALNAKLAADARVQSVLLPIADGLNICRKL